MNEPSTATVQVTYMELHESPAPPIDRSGSERIAREHLSLRDYLTLYRNVGEPLRWDQRLLMPEAELRALLEGKALNIYVLRDQQGNAGYGCTRTPGTIPPRFVSMSKPDSACTTYATRLLECSSASNSSRCSGAQWPWPQDRDLGSIPEPQVFGSVTPRCP